MRKPTNSARRQRSSISRSDFGLFPGTKPLGRASRRGWRPSYHGFFASHKALGPSPFDSLLERDCQTRISADWRFASYAVRPLCLTYWTPNPDGGFTKRSYTPDIVATDYTGRILIVEVKASYLARQEQWTTREPYIRAAFADDHHVDFLLFTEVQICDQPSLDNSEIMLSHRPPPDDMPAEMAVRDLLALLGPESTIGEVCAAASEVNSQRRYSAIMRLAIRGEISLDLSRPFSQETKIGVGARP